MLQLKKGFQEAFIIENYVAVVNQPLSRVNPVGNILQDFLLENNKR